MMQVYKLDGNTVDIISCPPENIHKGDYILVDDVSVDAALITQVINIGYADIPGILGDLLRKTGAEGLDGRDFDALQIKSFVDLIRDAKVYRCKIRRSITKGKLTKDLSWSPSRSTSRVVGICERDLLKLICIDSKRSISLGKLKSGIEINVPLSAIDGRLNIITGKKGTGKSHLSKLLVLSLVSQGGISIVFDVNGEYVNLGCSSDRETSIADQIYVMSPGENFKVTLKYMGLRTLLSIVSAVLDLPANSAWEIRRIWNVLEEKNLLTLKNFGEAIKSVANSYVRDALLRRYENLVNCGLFTDNKIEATTIEEWLSKIRNGGAVILNLRRLPSSLQRIVVEFMLSKLCDLLERRLIQAIFLFAEEAHLYLRETYWEDIVTRMRHLGIFPTFVTNQPDSISDSIYRQADNIFLFNFTNENDLCTVSKATMVDAQTINILAKELPPHYCLALGKVVNDFPIIINVKELKVATLGETRFFFQNEKSKATPRGQLLEKSLVRTLKSSIVRNN